MNIFKAGVPTGAAALPSGLAQHVADLPGAGAISIRDYPVGLKAQGFLDGAEERLSRLHIPVLDQHRADQIAVPVDRPVEVGLDREPIRLIASDGVSSLWMGSWRGAKR